MITPAERVRAAIARGDLISAYDESVAAIANGDSSAGLRFSQVLAVARMGDTERAAELFEAYGLGQSTDPHQQALGARILKDRALDLPSGASRDEALRMAADAYHAIHAESGDPYPGINAASLSALCGDEDRARTLATAIAARPEVADPADFFMAATRAEAELLLGKADACAQSLELAGQLVGNDHGARSTTCRQLELLARHAGLDGAAIEALLAPILPPRVIHFCGHIFVADPATESRLRAKIDEQLDRNRIAFGYGALAAGADILVAEALLERGGELHVVLPFQTADFIAQSVRPAGESWLARFERCLASAASVTHATGMGYVGDPEQFAYATRVAMGLTTLRAQHLGNAPLQLALWDGVPATGAAGTGADVAAWRARGGTTLVIETREVERNFTRPQVHASAGHERALAAIIFTDFPGFSRLGEMALPRFWDEVMGRIADVMEDHRHTVLTRNSWGDALYAVAASAGHAAEIALDLQTRLREVDYTRLGLENCGGMRIGAHYGPAYRIHDRISGRLNFYGTEVSRAARIEPVTPPGSVFVTEPFAAILALEAPERFRCRYVGRISLAKDYGTYPMYWLTRR